jgi:N-acetylglucosaminyldiphosphoundecaprenol N-acetyl-beta-D-mannosaminyltransferase
MKKTDERTNFLGKQFVSTSTKQVLNLLFSQVEGDTKTQIVFTPNPEQLVYAKSHSAFDKDLGKADMLLPDGIGIIYGAQFLSYFKKNSHYSSFTERISGVDVVSGLLSKFKNSKKKPKVLVIGGRGYEKLKYNLWEVASVNSANIESIAAKPKKHSLYWHEGFLNVTQQTTEEKKDITAVIKKLKPQVIFVALGAPHQEGWVIENRELLESTGVSITMVVGGTFDMLLGKVNRAPKWMQKIGLEWAFRLFQEPWRWRRQLKLLQFVKLVIQELLT